MNRSSGRFTPLVAAGLLAAVAGCDGTTDPVDPPPALLNVTATPSSHTEVELSWSPPPSGDVQEFRIERATAGGTFVQVATVVGTVFSYRDVGLDPATAYEYRVRVCGAGGCSAYTTTSVTTLAMLVITTESLSNGVRGEAYNGGLNATGGAAGYTWTVQSGSLPAGLSLSVLGILSGIPETVQTAVFVVRVRSEDGQTASKELTLRIVDPVAATGVTIVTPALPPALVDSPFNVSLTASGGDGSLYQWSVVEGSLPPGLSLSPEGLFTGVPLGSGSFPFAVVVTSGGHTDQRAYTIQVVAEDFARFNITPFEVATVPGTIRPHLIAAVARWERVVTGELGGIRIPRSFFSSTFCGGFGELVNGTALDDLIVMVDISSIDGAGKILGQAAPCGLRGSGGLPFVGVLTLDADDLAPLVGTQTLTDIIFHEIGHILGFGTLWGARQLLAEGGTSDPRFLGMRAVQEYGALGGTGSVPVEGTGGVGTADAHWRESVFRTEVMTGFSERVGTAMPLSRASIASFADLGYTVDVAAADAFTLPAAGAAQAPGALGPLGYDVILPGPVRYLPEEPQK
jgi:hypothetical protein